MSPRRMDAGTLVREWTGPASVDGGRRKLRALGAAWGDAVAHATARIEELHRGIAGRAFGAAGIGAQPARAVHDVVSGLTYAAVRGSFRAGGRAAGLVLAATPLAASPHLVGRQAGIIEGAVCGLYGDHLERRHPELAVPMTLRSAAQPVAVAGEALAKAYPQARPRLAVFVHGLCETEAAWGAAPGAAAPASRFGDRLAERLGITALYLRYNSGLHISDNGARLAGLLGGLVEAWPVAVEELSLIGHSAGGLVIRSACDIGRRQGQSWVSRVGHCVYLGTPHDGAPLERGVNLLSGTLRALPETRALATFLDVRSAGIKDLRFSYVREEDWLGYDADARLVDTGSDVPLLQSARHHVVAATLGVTPEHAVSRILGDLLVYHPSAFGLGRRGVPLEVGESDRRHIGSIHHFRLLDHPAVAELLIEWLSTAAQDPADPVEPEASPIGRRSTAFEPGDALLPALGRRASWRRPSGTR